MSRFLTSKEWRDLNEGVPGVPSGFPTWAKDKKSGTFGPKKSRSKYVPDHKGGKIITAKSENQANAIEKRYRALGHRVAQDVQRENEIYVYIFNK